MATDRFSASPRLLIVSLVAALALVVGLALHFGHHPRAQGSMENVSAQPAPATVLDLANWKLQLPVAGTSAGSVLEVSQPQLATYANSPYFTVDQAGDGVVFQAPVGGATTSGTTYPRSELREMTNSGQDKAGWSTTSGTSTMTVTEASTHLPVVKPQVVTAQVLGPTSDVLQVIADGARSNATGKYSICLRYNGTIQTPCLDSSYVSGTRYTVKIVAEGGRLRVYYNGVKKLDVANRSSGLYFKAGAYTQSNPSKGDDPSAYGEVVVYGLTVTHQ